MFTYLILFENISGCFRMTARPFFIRTAPAREKKKIKKKEGEKGLRARVPPVESDGEG
jgi:hypothetical protein